MICTSNAAVTTTTRPCDFRDSNESRMKVVWSQSGRSCNQFIRVPAEVTATSIVSCCSKPQNGLTFWYWLSQLSSSSSSSSHEYYYAPAPRVGTLSDDARLTSVCLSRTSGLSRKQRGLGRLKLAQR